MKTLAAVVTAASLSACAGWPDHGRGGFAEHHGTALAAIAQQRVTADELAQELNLQSVMLDVLILKGARHCIPARVELALTQKVRTQRALEAGLIDDADNDLVVLRHGIADIQQRLAYLNERTLCAEATSNRETTATTTDNPEDQQTYLREKIVLLLNSHGQFASEESTLLPQYAHALQLAAQAMQRALPQHIVIYGHTDSTGHEPRNERLAQQRAAAVRDTLTRYGVPISIITIESRGAREPYTHNDDSTHRLANRRVEVEVSFAEVKSSPTQSTASIVKHWSEQVGDLTATPAEVHP